MKFLCLIFSFYVLILSVKPCCDEQDCQGSTVIKKEQAGKTSSAENDCQGCCTFFSCSSCAGFITAEPLNHFSSLVPQIKAKCHTAYCQPFIKEITLSIWQPPQLS
ncbi:MAG TPA: DUF6660 family protein [Mucilaginibacter sp.]|nr:DUF6660 family protein [Mucilaginibacter sp.]